MEFLSMHPDVVIARRDNDSMELQFFQNELLYQDGQGLDWYRYHMHSKGSGTVTLKKCPSIYLSQSGIGTYPDSFDSDFKLTGRFELVGLAF